MSRKTLNEKITKSLQSAKYVVVTPKLVYVLMYPWHAVENTGSIYRAHVEQLELDFIRITPTDGSEPIYMALGENVSWLGDQEG